MAAGFGERSNLVVATNMVVGLGDADGGVGGVGALPDGAVDIAGDGAADDGEGDDDVVIAILAR
jgi:hypothetical protein